MARRGLAVVLTLLGVAVLVSASAFLVLYLLLGREPGVPASATLTLRIGGDLAEVAPDDLVAYLTDARRPTVRGIVENLRKAQVDDRVKAVVLKPTGFTTPYWAKIQEIRDAVAAFRRSGKPVYAYLEYAAEQEYYLATAADRIFLMPVSALSLTGVANYELFLRGTLDKAGVIPNLLHVGEYKTAVNTFTETGFTPPHREMAASLTRDLYEQIVADIAASRQKDDATVRSLIDEGPFLADAAHRAGLVDELAYEDEVDTQMEKLRGGTRGAIDGDDYSRLSLRSLGLNRGPRVAVIHAAGAIASGRSRFDPVNGPVVGSDTFIEYLRRARRDSSVRAIVLRVDSPGGSTTASDAIWRELMVTKQARADRPIVVSMSDLAASGGYYIAMAGDAIVAQPSTLTGSIGIFGGKFVTGGLYEKLGARIEATSVGRHAEMGSPARAFDTGEARKLQEQLQAFYDQFVEKVAASRGKTPEEIDRVARGRVWTGRQAREHGLIDELGGLETAVALAKARAGIDAATEVELVVYPPRRSFYELISRDFAIASGRSLASAWLSAELAPAERELLRALRGPLTLFRPGEPLALMPSVFLR